MIEMGAQGTFFCVAMLLASSAETDFRSLMCDHIKGVESQLMRLK